ncbi:hypothetical protein EBB54_19705 [Schaedlerella arabinosiphila]|uniref:Uncharacterized protein n=1 Tax=Schaedlerella arabinosiphila TaxID=2044587 RepID=A0A426DKY6_9FIRM|nr:hypothetical protein EBB54_19705 [Schaedlerella arabinosiphila]
MQKYKTYALILFKNHESWGIKNTGQPLIRCPVFFYTGRIDTAGSPGVPTQAALIPQAVRIPGAGRVDNAGSPGFPAQAPFYAASSPAIPK